MRSRLALSGALLLAPMLASGQAVGPEFQVNSYTTGGQSTHPARSVAMDATGNFVVVWTDGYRDGNSSGLFARRFAANGTPLTTDFQVNTYTTGAQFLGGVAMDAAGDFLVTWANGTGGGVFAQRYDAGGVAQGGEITVTTVPVGDSDVAMDPNGNSIIAWSGTSPIDAGVGIFAQRYDAAGAVQGGAFHVNGYTTGAQQFVTVAAAGNGAFVVSWDGATGQDGSGRGIVARRYDATGSPQGAEFQVNTYTTGDQARASVAMDADGRFVIVWEERSGLDGSGRGLFARRYDAAGNPEGGEFQVNSYTTGDQYFASVAMDAAGAFIVAWHDPNGHDGSGTGIFAQRYDAAGAPLDGEFQVNTYTTGGQLWPSVAMDSSGHVAIGWTDTAGHDGSSNGVFAQRFFFEPPDTEAPLVTVNSPNGGESIPAGSAFSITWTASDNVGVDHVDVEYSTDDGSSWNTVSGCSGLSGSATSCSWNPLGPATTTGRIRVTATDAASNAGSDMSDASYSVVSGLSFVTVTYPEAFGLTFQAGTTKTLRWIHNLGKNQACTLEVNRNYPGGPWELITSAALTTAKNSSTYSWLVPSGPTNGATARIRVSWNADPSIKDTANVNFTIASRVKMTQPNTAASWASGSIKAIKWTHNLGSAAHFNIAIDRNGDSLCEETVKNNVAASSTTAGTFNWKVCGTGPARICVTSTGNPLDTDASDAAFNITGTSAACVP